MINIPELSPLSSTHEYVRGVSQIILDQRDLVTLGGSARILGKVEGLNSLEPFVEMHTTQGNLEEYFPGLAESFKATFSDALGQLAQGGAGISGLDLVRAYEHAVETSIAAKSRQLRIIMFMPDAYGAFLDYFGVPVLPRIVDGLRSTNPELAEKYSREAGEWRGL